MRREMTTAEVERLVALADAGMLLTQAARALGRTPTTIRLWATRFGIVFRQRDGYVAHPRFVVDPAKVARAQDELRRLMAPLLRR